MPALQKAKEQGKKVVCKNNLKQVGISMNMYGSENDAKLPLNAAGNWLWDVSYATTDYIIATGGDKQTFYCPTIPYRSRSLYRTPTPVSTRWPSQRLLTSSKPRL